MYLGLSTALTVYSTVSTNLQKQENNQNYKKHHSTISNSKVSASKEKVKGRGILDGWVFCNEIVITTVSKHENEQIISKYVREQGQVKIVSNGETNCNERAFH